MSVPRGETTLLNQQALCRHTIPAGQRHASRSTPNVTWKRLIPVTAGAAICLFGLLTLELTAPFLYLRARNLLRDAIMRAGQTAPTNPNLVFLAIDSASVSLDEQSDVEELYGLRGSETVEARALRLMSNTFPWPRETYALVLDRLVKAGAKAVLFDLTFPTETAGDEPFRIALEEHRDRVVIGSNFVAASHTRPPDSLIPQTAPMDDRVAYTNFWLDEDDVVRHARYRVTFEQVQGIPPHPASEHFLSLTARGLLKAGYADRVPAGTEAHTFRYTAPPREGFRPHSLFEIFVPEYWDRNYQAGEFFRDKIVLIGAEGNWQHDEHPTPLGSMPGPELHLNAMNAAIHGAFIREASPRIRTLVTIGAALLAIGLSVCLRSPWVRLIALVAIDCLDVWLTVLAFDRLSLYVPCLPFLLQLNGTVLLGLVCDFTLERCEKTRVRRALEKYVSSNVVRELLDNPKQFQQSLGGVVKPVTILFSDIRGYSSVSARTDPQALVGQLNEYLSAMVECVFRHGGTLDKFIGDAVMAVWGNVRSDGIRNDATNAVRAAVEMRKELVRLNEGWQRRGLSPLRIGIAINHGEVVVGNIGSPLRMEFTVIGDAVNVSWKLQELTKQVDADLIVSKSVAALVVEHFELQRMGEFNMPGYPEGFEIFEVPRAIRLPNEQGLDTLQVR